MSLATRCTSCATVFRVVQDQLKVSEGWVRCGRCDTVFNAVEGLFDIDRDGLPLNEATGEPTPRESIPDLPNDVPPRPALPEAFGALLRERSDSRSEARPAQADNAEPPRFASATPADDPQPPPIELLLDVPGHGRTAAPAETASDAATDPPPEFLRHAERDARWQQPHVRRALVGGCALLLLVLAFQAMNHFRDGLAARAPGLRPLIVAWCQATGCRVEPPRRIADVTVESTGLAPSAGAAAGSGSFQLSVTLRNRGAWPVALPSVDLTLTDSNGQLVARRALSPSEFTLADAPGRPATNVATNAAAAPNVLKPESDTRLVATLATSARVVGYSVEVFYP